MQVCVPTTPAQIFHLLRRQMMRSFRRPLIVMTPKSLLRHKLAVSSPADLSDGKFFPVIGEIDTLNIDGIKKLVICSGKVYYDILEERRVRKISNVALVRMEQVHPFPGRELRQEIEKYTHLREVVWCQEEPKNQGCWYQISYYLRKMLNPKQTLDYVGREGSPSPAVGYYKLHVKQQKQIVNDALSVSD
jgi:2-oxoglutarate dehydrogenase E1 component